MIKAEDVRRCPAFEEGNKVVLLGRRILEHLTDANCAFLMTNLKPLIEALECNINPSHLGVNIENGLFRCQEYGCTGKFCLKLLDPIKKNEDTSAYSLDEVQNHKENISRPAPSISIKPFPFVKKLDASLAKSMVSLSKHEKHKKGSKIAVEGNPCSEIYIISEGEVNVTKNFGAAKNFVVGKIERGGIIGQYAFIANMPYPFTVYASTDVSVWKLPLRELEKILCENPSFRESFSETLCQMLMNNGILLEESICTPAVANTFMMTVTDAVGFLFHEKSTGILRFLNDKSGNGIIYLKDGECLHAEVESKSGEEALDEICTWKKGNFSFEPGEKNLPQTLYGGTMSILLKTQHKILK
jgi:CRP-like cAMP-binding protein